MTNTIFILDKSLSIVDALSNNGDSPKSPFFDDKYVQDLASGAETYEFSTLSNDRMSKYLIAGNYVAFKYNDKVKVFQIIETTESHEDYLYKTCYCEIAGLELINDVVRAREISAANVRKFMETVLEDTEWKVGIIDAAINNVQTVNIDKPTNVYSLIQNNLNLYDIEIEYRFEMAHNQVIGKYIDVYKRRGKVTKKRFEYGKNVSSVSKQVDMSELCTALIGIGTNNIDFKTVEWGADKPTKKPLNQDFVADEEAYKIFNNNGSHIMGVFQAETESPHELLTLTWNELQRRKNPKFTYNTKIEMIQVDSDEINIGDTVYVIDNDYSPALHLEARIGKLELSFADYTKNSCTLTNYKEIKSGILSLDTIQSIIDGKFPITSDNIADGAITEGKIDTEYLHTIKTDVIIAAKADVEELIADKASIKDLEATNAKIENLEAVNVTVTGKIEANEAEIKKLKADKVSVGELDAAKAEIGELIAKKADIEDLKAQEAEIKKLKADKAEITDLDAVKAEITILDADVAKINELVAGNITSSNIQAGGITSSSLTIEDGFIKDAMIGSVNAGKIQSGTLDTNRVNIQSDNGNLLIQDNTIQIRDNTRVRVQIGKDGAEDYSLSVWDAQGNIMFDARGMTQDAIKSEIIRNDMISPDANINGSKLNINSVISSINDDGSTTLKSSKINLDDINQTLDVAFKALKSTADDTKTKTESNTTAINVMQGQISTLIKDSTIEVDGDSIKIKDAVSSLDSKVDSFSSKLSSTESKINNLKVGGTNLLLDSSNELRETSFEGWDYYFPKDLIGWSKGDELVGRVYLKPTNQEASCMIHVFYSDSTFWQTRGNIIAAGTEGYSTVKITVPDRDDITRIKFGIRHSNENTPMDIVYYKNAKVERGNSPTDWSPAPQDIIDDIDDASKMTNSTGQVVYIKDQVSEINQNLSSITQKVGNIETEFGEDGSITQLKSQVSTFQQLADKFTMEFFEKIENSDLGIKEIMSYIDFSADGIVLGQKDYPIKLVITKNKIKFVGEEDKELAYFSDNKLLIQDAEIIDTLKIANYGFLPNAGGSLTIGAIK